MTDNTMPERIRVLMNFSSDQVTPICDQLEHDGTYSAVDAESEHAMGVEYVRVDLVSGDTSEPLAYGQCRWVMISDVWEVAIIGHDDAISEYYAMVENERLYESELIKIGPVIQPPEYD